jgi:phage gp16-like protein
MSITKTQIQNIKTFQKLLVMPDDIYREMLENRYNVSSCTKLSKEQAEELIKSLKKNAIASGAWKSTKKYAFQKYKYEDLGIRAGYATPKQMRLIEGLWRDVSYQKTDEEREAALNTFLLNRFGVSHLKWVEDEMVKKVVSTLKAMKRSK